MLQDGGPWGKTPIYPSHEDLWCFSVMSRYGGLPPGRDWFPLPTPNGDSPKGLADYFIDTAYPIEATGHGAGQVRVATYGDGATNADGDLFLVNPAGSGLNAEKALIAAYNASANPRYAAFQAWCQITGPTCGTAARCRPGPIPARPSKIWPNYGLAMLRSDESPAYRTTPGRSPSSSSRRRATATTTAQKISITMPQGWLLYPDYNAIQYENMAIGWTRNTPCHNTLLVDEQDAADATPTAVGHELAELKYLATSASHIFEGVEQRGCSCSREYLLDLFHATSKLPHTYDYMLHCFGRAEPAQAGRRSGRPTPCSGASGWWTSSARRPSPRRGRWTSCWTTSRRRRLRLSMAAEPEHASDARPLGRGTREAGGGKRKLARPPDHAGRAAQTTCGTRSSSPRTNRHGRIRSRGSRQSRSWRNAPTACWSAWTPAILPTTPRCGSGRTNRPRPASAMYNSSVSGGQFASVASYGYLRVTKDGTLIGRGDWRGFRLPLDRRVTQFTLNGQAAKTTRAGPDLVYGDASPPAATVGRRYRPNVRSRRPSHRRGRSGCSLAIAARSDAGNRNTLNQPLSGHVERSRAGGRRRRTSETRIPGGRTGRDRASAADGQHRGAGSGPPDADVPGVLDHHRPAAGAHRAQPLVVFAGPTLLNEYANRQGNYVVYSPKFIARFDMFHGLCRYLADDDGTVRLDGAPLFTLSDGDTRLLDEQTKHAFTWPREAPADLVAHAYDKCRWQSPFYGGRMAIRMDRGWTQFERAEFTIPGRLGVAERPAALEADRGRGRSRATNATPHRRGSVEGLRRRTRIPRLRSGTWPSSSQPPQDVQFQGLELKFSIGSLSGDNWQVGFCRPDEFDDWRENDAEG